MEKYTRWADLSTGINPFLPSVPRKSKYCIIRWLQILFGSVLTVLKLLLSFIWLTIWALASVITVVGPRPFRRFFDFVCGNLLLLTWGIIVKEQPPALRRLGLPTTNNKKAASSIQSRDLILMNQQSFVELVYLTTRCSPKFMITTPDLASKGLVQVLGFWKALWYYTSKPPSVNLQSTQKLKEVLTSTTGPFVFVPEGVATNGKGILHFQNVFTDLTSCSSTNNIHLFGFTYEGKTSSAPYFTPVHTVGSILHHLFQLATYGRWVSSLRVVVIPSGILPRFPKSEAVLKNETDELGNALPSTPARWIEVVRSLLASIVRAKTVDLSVVDFADFTSYYCHVNSGGKNPASDFTTRLAPHEHARR